MTESDFPFAGLTLARKPEKRRAAGKAVGQPEKAKKPSAPPQAPSGSMSSASPAPRYTDAERRSYGEATRKLGVEAERKRIAAVLESSASRGRERTALELLAYHDLDASRICTRLAALPTDEQLQRNRAASAQAKAGAVWDRALARLNGEQN